MLPWLLNYLVWIIIIRSWAFAPLKKFGTRSPGSTTPPFSTRDLPWPLLVSLAILQGRLHHHQPWWLNHPPPSNQADRLPFLAPYTPSAPSTAAGRLELEHLFVIFKRWARQINPTSKECDERWNGMVSKASIFQESMPDIILRSHLLSSETVKSA